MRFKFNIFLIFSIILILLLSLSSVYANDTDNLIITDNSDSNIGNINTNIGINDDNTINCINNVNNININKINIINNSDLSNQDSLISESDDNLSVSSLKKNILKENNILVNNQNDEISLLNSVNDLNNTNNNSILNISLYSINSNNEISLNDADFNAKLFNLDNEIGLYSDSEANLYTDNIIINSHFNLTDENGNIVGWILDNRVGNSNAMGLRNESHDGDGYSMGFSVGTIGQYVDFSLINGMGFYLIPKDSGVVVSIGEEYSKIFSFNSSVANQWNEIYIDTTKINGTKYFSISSSNNYNKIIVDDFYVVCNGLNKANYTSKLISIDSDEITVQFIDLSVGLISDWFWDFGDGTNSSEQNPIHTFKGDVFYPSLTVYGPNSNNTYQDLKSTACVVLSSNSSYSTIQSAIDNALDNDTIIINSYLSLDLFKENISINKNLTLIFNNTRLVSKEYSLLNKNDSLVDDDDVNNKSTIIKVGENANVIIIGLDFLNLKSIVEVDLSSILELINSSFINTNLSFIITNSSLSSSDLNSLNGNSKLFNIQFIDSIINGSSNINFINGNSLISDSSILNGINTTNSTLVSGLKSTGSSINLINASLDIEDSSLVRNFLIQSLNSNLTINNSIINSIKFNLLNNSNVNLNYSNIYNQSIVNISNSNLELFNSKFNNSRLEVSESNINLYNLNIVNNKFTMNISDSTVLINNISLNATYGFNLINSKGTIKDSNFTSSNIAVNQSGGNLEYSRNIFTKNKIAINSEGVSNLNYNILYNNTQFSLRFTGNGINANNNWWGTNSPTFINGSSTPSKFYDIYRAENSDTNPINKWLVLNLTVKEGLYKNISLSDESPIHILENGTVLLARNTDCILVIDLTTNNEGEITSNSRNIIDTTVPDISLLFISSNYGTCGDCNLTNGKSEFIFNSGERNANAVTFKLFSLSIKLPIKIDSTLPQITYITPFTIFNESLIVEIECDDENAIIYYTVDSSSPKNSSTRQVYTGPITINESTTLHVTALDVSGNYARYNLLGAEDISLTYLKSSDLNISSSEAIWGEYQVNINNTGFSQYNGPILNITKWINANIISETSPIIDKEGHIYIAADDGSLYCLNIEGKIIWSFETRSKIISTPAFGPNGNIYFNNWENSTVYELDTDGNLIWSYNIGDYALGASIKFGIDGTLYLISGNDSYSRLFAFKDDELIWTIDLPAISFSTPAIAQDGTIYIVTNNNTVACVNWDGTLRYYIPFSQYSLDGNESQISVSIGSNDDLYVINQAYKAFERSKTIQAISCYNSDGTRKWVNTNVAKLSGTPTYYNGVLYVLSQNQIYSLNAETGEILWTSNITNGDFSPSSVIVSNDGLIYFVSNNTVYGYNSEGEEIWSYELIGEYGNPFAFSSPCLSNDGSLIVATSQGVYAFSDLSADFTWEYVNGTNHTISFTSIASPGNNTYYWSFGDYLTSRRENPVHDYLNTGNYTVYLVVNHSGILLGRNMTIEVIDHDITPPSDVYASINNKTAIDASFIGSQILSLEASDDWGECSIYYTTDGSNPVNSSTRRLYYELITIEADTFIQFAAVDLAGNWGNVGKLILNISGSIVVNESFVEDIQRIFDESEAGSTILLDFDTIAGANFTINKPLNIVSNQNTLLIGNSNQPIFTIGENGSGTKINGFKLDNFDDCIFINGSSNVTVINTFAHSNYGIGFNIYNSTGVIIKDSTSNDSSIGLLVNESSNTIIDRVNISESYYGGLEIRDSYNSIINNSYIVANGEYETGNNTTNNKIRGNCHNILLDNTNGVILLNTYIAEGYFGIHFNNTNNDVDIINNTIYETVADGILFEGANNRINVLYNTIDGSFNGLHFNGYSNNIVITNNLVWNMHEHDGEPLSLQEYRDTYEPDIWSDLYGQAQNCVQVSAASINFGNGVFMENNIFIKQAHRSWEARHTNDNTYPDGTAADNCSGHAYNLWDGSGSYRNTGGAVTFSENVVQLVVDRIGDSTFRLRLKNLKTGEFITDIDPFAVTFKAGTFTQTVNFSNDSAIATFNTATSFNSVEAKISMWIYKSISWDTEITEGYNSSIKKNDSGYKAGEAKDNPNPVVPNIPDYTPGEKDSGYDDGYVEPTPLPDVPKEDENNDTGTGNGTGNGTGDGNGTGIGNGTGGGIVDGNNSQNGTDINTIEPGDDNQNNTDVNPDNNIVVIPEEEIENPSDEVDAGETEVISESMTTAGEAETTDNVNAGGSGGSNAYELNENEEIISTESILYDLPQMALLVLVLALFIIVGYYREKNEEE